MQATAADTKGREVLDSFLAKQEGDRQHDRLSCLYAHRVQHTSALMQIAHRHALG